MPMLASILELESVAQALLIISLVAATGLALGGIRIGGIGLGIAGVLFSGILFGHFGFKINPDIMGFAREFGLILFVYTIGMQVGPGFLASLRSQGMVLNSLAFLIVACGVLITWGLVALEKIPMPVAAGLFSGATTNTPSLAAAEEALKQVPGITSEALVMPGLGYAIAYPFGIVGIILAMLLLRSMFRVQPAEAAASFEKSDRAAHAHLDSLSLEVSNPNIDGFKVADLPGLERNGVVISRILHQGVLETATPDSVLRSGDIVHAVGPSEALEKLQPLIGKPSGTDLRSMPSSIISKRIVVSRKKALGKSLKELNFRGLYNVTLTRITRAEVEFTPGPHFTLQYGDTVIAVGEAGAVDHVSQELGNSAKQLDHPEVVPIFIGLALGVVLGNIPIPCPGLPVPVKLGLAGGPLLVALILSRVGRLGPLNWYMPQSANFMLRELGIILFLSCVGLKAGGQFFHILINGEGLYWMGLAFLITFVPLILAGCVAQKFLKLNYLSTCGLLAGSMTDPPALSFANAMAPSNAQSISYATVYPLVMILRVLAAQLLVLLLG
jgi:putative transport protein